MPEEMEKHLILNSYRLRTFEDARQEVVTYVEAKFGLRIRDSRPSDTSSRGKSDPMDVDAVNSLSLSSSKGKGSSSPRDGKGKSKKEKPKEPKMRTKVLKAYTKAKHRMRVSQVLTTRKRMQPRTFRNLHRHFPRTVPGTRVGSVTNGTMAGVSMSGRHEVLEQTYDTAASSLSLGCQCHQ